MVPTNTNMIGFFQRHRLAMLVLIICLVPWIITRISTLYSYQIPPKQTIHPNYYTFHEMSQSWDEGKKLGVINVNRMVTNSARLMIADYTKDESPADRQCTYLSLDPGYGIIVSVARKLFPMMPDSYLRATTLQVVADGIMLLAIFATFLRMGVIPAAVAGLIYAIHPVFSYQAIFPFQYFWEGWLFASSMLALIWARRFSLSNRPLVALGLVIFIALATGFSLWVRSSAIVVAITFLLSFICVPSLRRYLVIYIFIFSLAALPQVVRASSAQGHFAISTRMSWHTAYHALGRYPNRFGIEDEDRYVFDTTQNEYGVAYNYCDYSQHDVAAKKAYEKIWEQDPQFIIRSVVSRIVMNILYSHNFEMEGQDALILFLLGVSAFIFALLRRGEYLFIAGLAAFVYLGYSAGVGMVYFITAAYSYVPQLALTFAIPVFAAAVTMGLHRLFTRHRDIEPIHQDKAPLAKFVLALTCIIMLSGAAAFTLPQVRDYIFQKKAYQYVWFSYLAPNREDNQMLVSQWANLPPDQKQTFLDEVHKTVPATDRPADDVARYIANNYLTTVYLDRNNPDNPVKSIFTMGPQKIDLISAMKAVSISIPGWNMEKLNVINISDPDSWTGAKVHIVLKPEPELAQTDYQAMATKKLNRYNYDVTWLGPYELIARHNGHGCDAMRAVMAVYYRGYCPYDARTGTSPLTPEMDPAGAVKSLTSEPKTGL